MCTICSFQVGEVLVTDKTDPDWEPIVKEQAAIITNRGGRTCHAAIVSRELGVPAVVPPNTCPEGGCQGFFTVFQDPFARLWIRDEPRLLSAWR